MLVSSDIQASGPFDVAKFTAPILCERPNNRIYEFNAHMYVPLPMLTTSDYDGVSRPLDATNMLLRGCILRNTPSVVGVVCTAPQPESKWSLSN